MLPLLQVDSVCALFYLLRFFSETGRYRIESAHRQKLKSDLQALLIHAIKPVLPRLLRSFDPAITDPATGNNALHDVLSRISPTRTEQWLYKLIEALIQHGVDIHQRDKQGRTVALTYAASGGSWHESACSLHLLLQHGADVNAQDDGGETMTHHLIHGEAYYVLQDLLEGEVRGLDVFVPNRAGHTAAELAAIMHVKEPGNPYCSAIHRIIQARVEQWHTNTRPAVLSALSEPLIPDLARLVLGYVDGSGRAFISPALANAEAE